MQRSWSVLILASALAGIAPGQFSQFGAPASPPAGVVFDDVKGELVNYETQLAKPILVTRNGSFLVVANEPDNRVSVFSTSTLALVKEVPVGQGICSLTEAPSSPGAVGEIWVTLRHQTSTVVINPTTWRVSHVLRPTITSGVVGSREADSPGGIAFDAGGTHAFVPSTATGTLTKYALSGKTFVQSIPLQSSHQGQQTSMNDPFCVAATSSGIWVASTMSGNQTIAKFNPTSVLPEPKVEIQDLTTSATESLPDFDLMLVDPATGAVTAVKKNVASMIFGLAVHPTTGKLLVANYHSRNGEFVGERAFAEGKVVFNRLTIVDPAGPAAGPHTHILLEDLSPGSNPRVNCVMPTDIAVDATGRIFIAGYASSNIVVLDSAGVYQGVLPSNAGPRGLAYAASADRLYCLNRGNDTVTYYDLAGGLPPAPTGIIRLPDPTFENVKAGRVLFNTARSEKGTTFCGSCHPDSRKDGLGWDLSKYHDPGSGFTLLSPPQFWQDRKGVMITQDLRSLGEVPPYHWRGEQLDLEDFNAAFVALLHGSEMDPDDFTVMKEFVFSCVYPPNPFQAVNRNFTAAAVDGADAFQVEDADELALIGEQPLTGTCIDCHALPTGTDCSITDPLILLTGSPALVKTTQLRGMWEKESPLATISASGTTAPSTGFGFEHDGLTKSANDFMDTFFAGVPRIANIKIFVGEFDSGLAPATSLSAFYPATNGGNNSVAFINYLMAQALASRCDLIVKGRVAESGVWHEVGMFWSQSAGAFVVDRATLGPYSLSTLITKANSGRAELHFLGVPLWSGERLGVDRDRDRLYDGDEIAAGSNPTVADTDGDGFWDGEDSSPTGGPNSVPVTAPAVVPGSIQVAYVTTNSAKITYETDRLSPTRVEWGETSITNNTGDPFPLPTGGTTQSNLWKRRHVAFLRLTKDGVAHQFQIRTQGQNNVLAVTSVQVTPAFLADHHNPNIRVKRLTTSHALGSNLYSVTVEVQDNAFAPAPNVWVSPRWTVFVGGVPSQTFAASAQTNASGQKTFSFTAPPQVAGDSVVFDVTMTFPFGGTFLPGLVSATQVFAWPENLESSVTMPF